MKKLLALIIAFSSFTVAQAAPPTQESIEKLLKVIQVEKTLDALRPKVYGMMQAAMDESTKGQVISPAEQMILDNFRNKASAIVENTLTIDKFMPFYIDIYTKSFTQEEVDGLITFYQSPAGKAFVTKMPVVAQTMMAEMPRLMNPMMKEMQKATEEMQQELAAMNKKPAEK